MSKFPEAKNSERSEVKLTSQVASNAPSQAPLLSPENWAILKHVWKLSAEHSSLVKKNEIFVCTASIFLDSVNIEHPYRDIVEVRGKKYEVCYLATSFNHIESSSEALEESLLLLVCLRTVVTSSSSIGIALVKLAEPSYKLSSYRTLEF